jgi:TusA-related sulfurtransferase
MPIMGGKTAVSTDPRLKAERVGHQEESSVAAKRFVEAIAARDYKGLFGAMAPDVRFRYLIPPGPGEVVGAADVAAKYFDWFGDADALEVQSVQVGPLADRTSARYRFLLHEQDGWKEVEQQTYVDVDAEGRITAIDLLCSGFRPAGDPEAGASSGTHRFDAGTLGCADGLAQEFRRRILAIPLRDILVVETSDPAAKEDLPPLARMMGHTVRSIEPSGDGRLLITVERGR